MRKFSQGFFFRTTNQRSIHSRNSLSLLTETTFRISNKAEARMRPSAQPCTITSSYTLIHHILPGLVGDLARLKESIIGESSVLPGGVKTNARLFMISTLLVASLDLMPLCHWTFQHHYVRLRGFKDDNLHL